MSIIIDTQGYVEISTLTHHPLNELLYPLKYHEEDIALLADKLVEEQEKTGVPNHTPIVICKETGTIFSGNFRVRSAKSKGIKKLKAVYASKIYNAKDDQSDELKFLEKFNIDGKRDEYNERVLLRRYSIHNKLYEQKYGKVMNAKLRNQFATENRYDQVKFKYLIQIEENDPNLLEKVLDGKMTIQKALRVLGKVKDPRKYNPDRFNFFKALDKYPSIQKNAVMKAYECIGQFKNMGNNIIHDEKMGWEVNQLTGVMSNIWMSALVYGFNKTNVEELQAQTPRNRQGYADLHFQNLTDKFGPEFLSERIEVKVGTWNTTCSQTVVYGGMGSVRVSAHEYLIAFHNQKLNKHLVILTTMDKNDWKTDGKDANATMTLSHWFNKYHNQKDKYRILVGDIYKGNKSIEVTWGDMPQVLDKAA